LDAREKKHGGHHSSRWLQNRHRGRSVELTSSIAVRAHRNPVLVILGERGFQMARDLDQLLAREVARPPTLCGPSVNRFDALQDVKPAHRIIIITHIIDIGIDITAWLHAETIELPRPTRIMPD
jgi:hypothetical protein